MYQSSQCPLCPFILRSHAAANSIFSGFHDLRVDVSFQTVEDLRVAVNDFLFPSKFQFSC